MFHFQIRMADTRSKRCIHLVLEGKGRQFLMHKAQKEKLNRYIAGMIHAQKGMNPDGMPHPILIGIKPDKGISDWVRDLKSHASMTIN